MKWLARAGGVGGIAIVGVLACGGAAKQRETWTARHVKSERPLVEWTTADEDAYIQRACTNIIGPDGALRCPSLATAGLRADRCADSFADFRAAATTNEQHLAVRIVIGGLSLAQSCAEVDATFRLAFIAMRAAPGRSAGREPPGCQRREDGAFALDADGAARRRGRGDRTFADTASSLAEPIAVCGLSGELGYLMQTTCTDGAHPWTTLDQAHQGRVGAQMVEGPCGTTPVDRYVVPCPEKRYEVFVDMYRCGPGERFE